MLDVKWRLIEIMVVLIKVVAKVDESVLAEITKECCKEGLALVGIKKV